MAKPEMCLEMVECARFEELEEMCALLDNESVPIDFQDKYGNTALHMACANGHTRIVCELLKRGAKLLKNEAGNNPLHWAVENGQKDCVRLLLKSLKDSDVMEENEFGKSAVTLAFQQGDLDVTQQVLEHPSAAKLEEEADKTDAKLDSVTHTFDFGEKSVLCGEVASRCYIDSFKNVEDAELKDSTGMHLWSTAVVMAHWLQTPTVKSLLHNKHLLELGAGCGLVGLTAHCTCAPASLLLTDLFPDTLTNLQTNAQLNNADVEVDKLDWLKDDTWPRKGDELRQFEVVLGSDLIYDAQQIPLLINVLDNLLMCGGTFLYGYHVERDGATTFPKELEKTGRFQLLETAYPASTVPCFKAGRQDMEMYFTELFSSADDDFIMMTANKIN
eukprot:Platyproteum_vivax@DN2283_c0_g1_i2.p1